MTNALRASHRAVPSGGRALRALAVAIAGLICVVGSVSASPRDAGFGSNGVAQIDLGGDDRAVAGFLLASGKYLLVGQSRNAAGKMRIAVARMNRGGGLDQTFADDGRALSAPLEIKAVEDAARTTDGRIVVMVQDANDRHALVGLKANGSVDASFGNDGVVRTESRSYGWGSMVAAPNGKILVAADDLIRYTSAGAIDTTFGRHGAIDLVGTFSGSLTLDDDGNILAFGACGACVVGRRYDDRGRRDRDFGRVIDDNAFQSVFPKYHLTGVPMAGVVSARGRIFIAGLAGNDGPRFGFDGLAVAFTRNGKPARGFDRDGWRAVDFGEIEWFTGIVALPNERILVAGSGFPRRKGPSDAIVLAMLNRDGSMRHRFGNRGKATLKAVPGREAPEALDLFLDGGRAVVVGEGGDDFLVARYRLQN